LQLGKNRFAWEKAIRTFWPSGLGEGSNTVAAWLTAFWPFGRGTRWMTAFWHADEDLRTSRCALDEKDEKDLFGHADGELGG